MFDQIEKLKTDYTDKYVVVDATIAELARFEGYVGQIKTINMSGRALVQFDAWNNIGWYDIDVGCLTVVPKPEAGAEAKKHDDKKQAPRAATKPDAKTTGEGGGKKLSPLEMARQQGAAKPAGAAAGAKQSTADILAAARANKAGGAAPAAAPKAEAKAAPAAKPAGGKMSTADILAAARANKEGGTVTAPAASAAPAEAEPVVEAAAPAAKPAAKAGGATGLPAGRRATVPEILAWCREHDAH